MTATTLHVGGASPYDVVVGRDLLDRLPGILGQAPERVALVQPPCLGPQLQQVGPVDVEHLVPLRRIEVDDTAVHRPANVFGHRQVPGCHR